MTISAFAKKRKYFWWYVKDPGRLSPEAIVEGTLNYGDMDDVRKLIAILGMKKTAAIFRKRSRLKRSNYRPEIQHYFRLYFNRYA